MAETIPVLYLAYNRPTETDQSFNILRQLQVKNLYVALDGPKDKDLNDFQRCAEVRKIVERVDWECNVRYLIREKNMGCRWGVNSALDWFFHHEEMGIIVEDDILINECSHTFISELLEFYKDEEKVMMICACNLLNQFDAKASYIFSKIGGVWGWGTWRRVWHNYDPLMKNWDGIKNDKQLFSKLPKAQAIHREITGQKVYDNEIDTWDYPFTIHRILNDGLAVVPVKNLIYNIGFNEFATHTKEKGKILGKLEFFDDLEKPLIMPKYLKSNKRFDRLLFDQVKKPSLIERVLRKFKSLQG